MAVGKCVGWIATGSLVQVPSKLSGSRASKQETWCVPWSGQARRLGPTWEGLRYARQALSTSRPHRERYRGSAIAPVCLCIVAMATGMGKDGTACGQPFFPPPHECRGVPERSLYEKSSEP